MKNLKILALIGASALLGACGDVPADKTMDLGLIDNKPLSQMIAGIWVDPNGCDHWMIDDGIEGYLSPRLRPTGEPVCSGVAPPHTVTGPVQTTMPMTVRRPTLNPL